MKEKMKDLKQIDCGPECGFMIRSHDEKELLDLTKMHVKGAHNLKMTDADLRPRMMPA
jgi:predicted small metal-binding protein